jgi:hypothetical protein
MITPRTINSISPATTGRGLPRKQQVPHTEATWILCAFLLLALGCFALSPLAQAAGKGPPVFPTPTPSPTPTPTPTPTPAPTPLGEDRGNGNSAAENVEALNSLTTGLNNTATGWQSLYSNTEGIYNTATGFQALYSNTGNFNTANGVSALYFNTTGSNNTATGWESLYSNTEGVGNTANGVRALLSNATGSYNTATGLHALYSNTGSFNTANGVSALESNTEGIGNTAVGYEALLQNTGSGNIALGYRAGFDLTAGNSNIYIGSSGVPAEENTIRIGSDQTTTFIKGISATPLVGAVLPVVAATSGQLGVAPSSRRFKKEIKPMNQASEAILGLKPVTFHYKSDKTGTPQFGLIAEEVAEVNPDLVVRDEKGETYTVRYDAVNAMLLNEFLKEHRKVEGLKVAVAKQKKDFGATIAQQQKEIRALTASLKDQASQIQKVSARLELIKPAPRTVLNNQ